MAAFNTIAGSMAGRAAGSLAGGGSSAPLSLDAVSAPNALFCFSCNLLTAYSSNLFRLRRASDNAETDIGFNPITWTVDTAAIVAHCTPGGTPTDGFGVTAYDISGNARHRTMATTAKQPKIYDAASGATLLGSSVAAFFDSAGANSDELSAPNAFGLSGATAVSVWSVWRTATAAGQPGAFAMGSNIVAGDFFEQWANTSSTQLALSIGGARRIFTSPDITAGVNNTIACLAAGAGIGTATLMRNGVDLAEASAVNPSNTMTLGANYGGLVMGALRGIPLNGPMAALGVWGSVLTAPEKAACNAVSLARFGA